MAVGYQYQSDYDKKENKKGFKKKFVILGIGLALLVVIAIIGAPKKQENIQETSNSTSVKLSTESSDNSLPESLYDYKNISDSFMSDVLNKSDPLKNYYDARDDKTLLENKITSDFNINANSCSYVSFAGYADYLKLIPSFKYNCSAGESEYTIFVATIKPSAKIFNWGVFKNSSSSDYWPVFVKKINNGGGVIDRIKQTKN
jgi:hypothetical protein